MYTYDLYKFIQYIKLNYIYNILIVTVCICMYVRMYVHCIVCIYEIPVCVQIYI